MMLRVRYELSADLDRIAQCTLASKEGGGMQQKRSWRAALSGAAVIVLSGGLADIASAEGPAAVPTFAGDVAPILYENCVM